jgi:acetyl-CoA carboxylase biotin carboxyl carrier protein
LQQATQEIPVADVTVNKPGPFDVKTVEALVALMADHDLSEIYLSDGEQRLRLRRGAMAGAPVMMAAAPPPAVHAPSAAPKAAAPEPTAAPRKNLVDIKSEYVGTYYAQPKPGEPPYLKVGDRVAPNKPIGLLEAMKTFTEIQANVSGVVVEVLAENGQFIEHGTVLFRIDPAA